MAATLRQKDRIHARRLPALLARKSTAPEAADHRPYPFMEWSMLVGAEVDVRREGVFIRTGLVDDTTPSGDTACIAADGIDHRIMIEKTAVYDLWITADQLLLRRVHQPSDSVAEPPREGTQAAT